MIELSVAVGAHCLKAWEVSIEELLTRSLFSEPEHLEVELFGMRQDSVIGLIVSRRVKLTNKNGSARVLS